MYRGACSAVTAQLATRRLPSCELGVGGHLAADVGERDDAVLRVRGGARHATDDLAVERQLGVVGGQLATLEREHAEAAVRLAAVVEPRDRLLARGSSPS